MKYTWKDALMFAFAIALVIYCLLTPAHAADPTTLVWNGPINDEFAAAVEARRDTLKVLVLTSHGGSVTAAKRVLPILRRGVTTRVLAGHYCESACSILFHAGLFREASRTANFLYHVPVFPVLLKDYQDNCVALGVTQLDSCQIKFNLLKIQSWTLMRDWLDTMEQIGASQSLLWLIRNMPNDEPWGVRGNFTEIGPLTLTGEQLAKQDAALKLID